jgi:hypothetical protein
MNPQFPLYVISKGRWESRLTIKSLEWMGLDFFVAVEPQEYDKYAAVVKNPKNILVTPFSNLGQGSIPVRNFIWEHSISLGAFAHWCVDDNIRRFYRLHENGKIPCKTGVCFRAIEDFFLRYENMAQAGMHYYMFAPRKVKVAPINWNRRIYSNILIRNDIPYRWRGRYNEDTDLSLRVLKDGWCTVIFLQFLAQKISTMLMKGGNTDELYKDDGRLKMAQSLVEQHPDVTKISWKWGRWQHEVDYRRFKFNTPKLKPGLVIPEEDQYPMKLEEGEIGSWL